MSVQIHLPRDWAQQARQVGLVPEGDYVVTVQRVECESETRFRAEYRIEDEGPCQSWVLFEKFSMDKFPAKFYDALFAAGFPEDAVLVEPEQLAGSRLRVTVKHRKGDNGKTWANVVKHQPAGQ